MSFAAFLQAEDTGSEVEKIIARVLASSSEAREKAAKMGIDAFNKVVRRSMARTGVNINKQLRLGFTMQNPLGIEPLRKHPESGIVMALQAKKYRPAQGAQRPQFNIMKERAPGAAFRTAMNYHLLFEDNGRKELFIGAETPPNSDIYASAKKRPFILSRAWQERFRAWQQPGILWGGSSTRRYLHAINIPISSGRQLVRPERDIIGKTESRMNPVQMLEQALIERLAR